MESYKELEEAVWKPGLCTKCGACVAVCPSGTISFKEFSPVYGGNCKVVVENVPCGACYNSCGKAHPSEPGKYNLKFYAAKSSINAPYAQSGGAVTSLLVSAFESGLIDGALVVGVDRFSQEPQAMVVTTKEEVMAAAGSRYSWGNVLEGLGDAVKSRCGRLAIVGTPCAIESVRRIMSSNLDVLECYGKCIRFTIGVFCSGIFGNIEDAVCKELDIGKWQIKKTEIKDGKVYAHLKNEIKQVPFKTVKDYVLPGCAKCTDFASRFADVSAGNIGTEEGFTTLIIRNASGKALVSNAVELGNISLTDDVDESAIGDAVRRKKGMA
jgi:coenzyme F420 hydrogenase subunit beta